MAHYVIEFHKDGARQRVGSHAGPLEQAVLEARNALDQKHPDYAVLIDMESLMEICTVQPDA